MVILPERCPNKSCLSSKLTPAARNRRPKVYFLCRARHKKHTFGRYYSEQDGHAYLGTWPSKKSIRRVQTLIRQQTAARMVLVDADIIVERLNRALRGWATYFSCGPVSKAYRTLDRYTAYRLRRWLCRKHKVRYGGLQKFPCDYLYGELHLLQLCTRTRNLPWANV